MLHRCPRLVKDYHGSTMRTPELPACMKHSGFAGLIPRNCDDLVKSALLSAHIAYMIDFSQSINPGGFQSVRASYDKQKKISEITMEEGRMADDGRAAYLHSAGLFDIETFKTVVTVANELMREVNADKISEDAIDAALLSVVKTMSTESEVFPGATSAETEVFPSATSAETGSSSMEVYPGTTSAETGSSSKEVFPGATSGEMGSSSKEVFPSGEMSLSPLNQTGDLVSLCSSLGSNSSPCGADVGDTTEKDVFPSASSGGGDATTEKEVIPSASSGEQTQ